MIFGTIIGMEDDNKSKTGRWQQVKDTFKTSSTLISLVWQTDRWLFLGVAVSMILPAFVPLANMYVYKLIIDSVVKIISGEISFNPANFYPLILARLLTYFLSDVINRTQTLMGQLLWAKVPVELSQKVLSKISSLDVHYFENDKFRDQLEKVRQAYDYRPQQLMDALFYCLQGVVEFLIALIALARLNPLLVGVIALVAIPEFVNQNAQSKFAWNIWDTQSPFRKRYNYLDRLLQGHREMKELRIFRLARGFLAEMRALYYKFYQDSKRVAQKTYTTSLIFNTISAAVYLGIEVYVVFLALAKRVSVGDIGFYSGMVSNFQSSVTGLLRNTNKVFENSLYLKSVFDILEVEPIVPMSSHPVVLNLRKPPVIEFKNVSFTYPDSDNKILNNFSLKINPGEKVAFVGENGAGKSTVIKLLARFYDVDHGEILINGVNIKNLDRDSWYQRLGVLFQEFNKYEDLVRDNIYYGDVSSKMSLEKVVAAATSAGAHPMIGKLEKGYDSMLGKMFKGGVDLSGGQWQKIALSRAFFRNAPILVLDEPTASIDAKAEAEIFSRVGKLAKNKTVIIISHRFSTVRNADRIFVIENGQITESGTHQQLMKIDGQYASLFKIQAKGYQ